MYMDAHCVYSDPTINSATVFHVNNKIVKELLPFTELHNVTFEVLKTVVPTSDGIPFLLKNRTEAEQAVRGLTMELKDSKLFNLAAIGKINVVKATPKAKSSASGPKVQKDISGLQVVPSPSR
jgi:hypothetical protein